jgi:hypothetical protein
VAVLATSVLIAGCGGGSHATVTTSQNTLAAYASCIRSHGVSDFPDPTGGQGIPKDKIPVWNPRLPAASKACAHLMPTAGLGPQVTAQQTHTRVANAIAFARCVRSHGFPRFPDPTNTAQITHQMLSNAGINLHQPAVLRAADACVGVTHGQLTKATVANFIAGS